jgi:hypothetical protein
MTEIARLELGARRPDGSCEVAVVDARGHRHKGVLADPGLVDGYLDYLDSAGLDRPAVTGTGAAEPARPARAPDKPHPSTVAIPVSKLARLVATAARAPSVHNTQPWRFRACAPQFGCGAAGHRRAQAPAADRDRTDAPVLRLSRQSHQPLAGRADKADIARRAEGPVTSRDERWPSLGSRTSRLVAGLTRRVISAFGSETEAARRRQGAVRRGDPQPDNVCDQRRRWRAMDSLASALSSGRRGRRFKSGHPDQVTGLTAHNGPVRSRS